MLAYGSRCHFLMKLRITALDQELKSRLSKHHNSGLFSSERCVWPLFMCSFFIVIPSILYLSAIISDYANSVAGCMTDMLTFFVFYFFRLIKTLDEKYVKQYSYFYSFLRRELVLLSFFFCLIVFLVLN